MVPGGGGRGMYPRTLLRAGAGYPPPAGISLFSNTRNPVLECSILLTYRTAYQVLAPGPKAPENSIIANNM
ncbi:hypothetical protein BDE02_13G041500 [Populus trichocarpa]|nr:hypothetical protein BDE02_13G041500 [Populus trichocarpa]